MQPMRRKGVGCRLFGFVLFYSAIVTSSAFAQTGDTPQSNGIQWHRGPTVADLGGVAEIQVPKDFAFADASGAQKFLELSQNPTSGNEVGVLIPVPKPGSDAPNWFMLFEYNAVGHIKDDDRNSLDADRLLSSIKEATKNANELRKEKGWPAFNITGWAKRPFYDETTHNLTWAVEGEGEGANSQAVTYSVRILGRTGTMSVDLVLDPKDLDSVLPQYTRLIQRFNYKSGSRYAEFVRGDKLAGYGLAALIAGGVGAAAVKTGLIAKLWKLVIVAITAMWKLVIVVVAALVAFVKKILNKFRGTPDSEKLLAPPEPATEHAEQLPVEKDHHVFK